MSKLPSSQKQGRPRLLDQSQEAWIRSLFPDLKTTRGVHDQWFAIKALGALRDTAGLDWLFSIERMTAGDAHAWRPKLMSELGRFEDRGAMTSAAAQICALKPRTADGVRLLRQWRTGLGARHDRDKLGTAIAGAIDSYRAAHAGCPLEDVQAELWSLWEVVGWMIQRMEGE